MQFSKLINPIWPASKKIRVYTITRNFFNNIDEKRNNIIFAKSYLNSNLVTLGITKSKIYNIKQCHGIKSIQVPLKNDTSHIADGIYTKQKGAICSVFTADCMPIVITNNAGSFVSIIHVGWKGLYNDFISTFISSISINPNSCIVWIGPSISQKFYSVDKLFYKFFVSKNKEYRKFFIIDKNKYYFSLQDSAIYQFNRINVKQVFVSNLCTYDNNNLFFSYRKNKTLMRFPTLAWIE
tara:strand:+ start:1489 stop:2202 length:714 start_codon:yes stop_codon:yes gene_type:complete